MILQLNPQFPVNCPKGEGYAIALLDYSQDHDLFWIIAITETGEIWTYPNKEVRALKNITLGRLIQKSTVEDLRKKNQV
jgi:hypothetical protein